MKQSIGNPQLIRRLNEGLVLDLLSTQGPLSRADLSRITGLSKPTISSATSALLEKNLIFEMGVGDNVYGRKSTLLKINEFCFFSIGIDIGATKVRIGIADLLGRLLSYQTYPLLEKPEEFLTSLRRYTEDLLRQTKCSWESIQFVTIGAPAVVVPETGKVLMIVPQLKGYENVFSQSSLKALFPCEIILENDVNLAVLGEKTYGIAKDQNNFVFLSLGVGIGAGVMVEGQLLRGLGGAAGELGEMKVSPHTDDKLEQFLSSQGLVDLANRIIFQDKIKSGPVHNPMEVFERYRYGESWAQKTVEQYCDTLSYALLNLSVILAPDMIVIGGGVGSNGDVILPELQRRLSDQSIVQPTIVTTSLDDKTAVLGGIHLSRQKTMQYIKSNLFS